MPIRHLCALHIPFFSEIQHRFNDFLFCSLSHAAHIRNPPCSCSAKSKDMFRVFLLTGASTNWKLSLFLLFVFLQDYPDYYRDDNYCSSNNQWNNQLCMSRHRHQLKETWVLFPEEIHMERFANKPPITANINNLLNSRAFS